MKMPRGFSAGHDGSIACPHRDCSCCDACAKAHPEIVEVYAVHFWIADDAKRASLRAELRASQNAAVA